MWTDVVDTSFITLVVVFTVVSEVEISVEVFLSSYVGFEWDVFCITVEGFVNGISFEVLLL